MDFLWVISGVTAISACDVVSVHVPSLDFIVRPRYRFLLYIFFRSLSGAIRRVVRVSGLVCVRRLIDAERNAIKLKMYMRESWEGAFIQPRIK